MEEASAANRIKLGGYGSTTTGGTGSVFISGILTEIGNKSTINTNTHTNDETVKVRDIIYSDSESGEGSNCDTEDSYFCGAL